MISLEKIAELSGVSRRTVARALKDKSKVKDSTLAKIEAVLKEYDYEPNLAARYLAAKNQNFKILYMVYRSESSQFHARIFELAKAKAAELRGFGITIDFLVLDHGQADPLGDIKRITADFNYDFLIALPIYEEFFQPYVHALFCKVQELHIPMIFYNMDDTSYKRDCYIGCDYEKSGRIAAGLIALITQSKGKIAILSHRSSRIISFMERVHGFKGELFQKYHDIEIVYTHTMENDYIDVDFDFLREQKVKAIYLVNPGDYSVCLRIREELKGLDVKIITNDLLPISQKYMQDGIISAVITQNEEIQAKKPLDLAFKILVNKEKIDFDKYYTQLGILISQCI